MRTDAFYAVDRLRRRRAVVIGDRGDRHEVEVELLPARLREGDVLRVQLGPGGEPDWAAARIDREESERRRKEAENVIEELRRRDPGGDSEL